MAISREPGMPFPKPSPPAQDEAIGQGLTSDGIVIAQVGVKIFCTQSMSRDAQRYRLHPRACTKYAVMLAALL